MEGVKDHIVSSVHGKASPFLMWKALTYLFKSKSDQKKLALKDKLRNIKMEKGDRSSSKASDEENYALAAKEKKGKSKKSSQSGAKGKKQDMSMVKCFHYHPHGHYATNCP